LAYLLLTFSFIKLIFSLNNEERHRDKGCEPSILDSKAEKGVCFFTSQVVYNVDSAIWLLRDYDKLCKEKNVTPARIVFTFAPWGREDTCNFLKWLGVEIPEGTEKRVLSRATIQEGIDESISICEENLRRIVHALDHYNLNVPIGITVETVSKYRDEFTASIRLFKRLSSYLLRWSEKKKQIGILTGACEELEEELEKIRTERMDLTKKLSDLTQLEHAKQLSLKHLTCQLILAQNLCK